MPAVYGSATIANAATAAIAGQGVQPPIAYDKLTAANTEMLNGHIGAALDQEVTPQAAAELIAADDTPSVGNEITEFNFWDVTTGTWVVGTAPAAPANTVAPAITGTAQVGQVLTTTNGTWTGSPTPTFTRQWKVAGVNAGTGALTYTPVIGDIGKTVTCTVTATNVNGVVSQISNTTAAVIAA